MTDNAPTTNTGLTPNSIAPQDYIAGLAKGLQLLQAFDHAHQRLNATQAASRTGLTRAAARRYLLTLQSLHHPVQCTEVSEGQCHQGGSLPESFPQRFGHGGYIVASIFEEGGYDFFERVSRWQCCHAPSLLLLCRRLIFR